MTNVLSGRRMLSWWRAMIVGLTCFAAIATPGGEPISMLLLAGPLCVLYFLAVGFSLLNDMRRRRNDSDAQLRDDEASELDLTPEGIGEIEPVAAPVAVDRAVADRQQVNGYDDAT
jgi:sec-independent protein translocase protein TatC